MSRRYRLSAPAQLDAEELFDFIAARDFDRAIRIERELFDTLTLLATRPLIGHSRADLDVPPRLRVWPFYS